MKARFILFRRGGVYYCEDTTTRKQSSLRTRDEAEAITLLNARNESFRQPRLNVQIARAYLTASDPAVSARTWQAVMDQLRTHGKPATQVRCARAMLAKGFDSIRHKALMETASEHLLAILATANVSEAHYLRRLHNLAVGLGWLPWPVLAPKLWPKPQYKAKRGITPDEHQRILAAERNPERNLYYQLLWEVGASQGDAAALTAENLDWPTRTLTYFRMKTGEQAQMAISKRLEAILNHLPTEGALFPKLSKATTNSRAADFRGLCKRLRIDGVSLHSYRYAWAERAKTCGYPERFAQAALGHNSQAVHRAYAKKARVLIPSLEDYENSQSSTGPGAAGSVAKAA
jgi:integrase